MKRWRMMAVNAGKPKGETLLAYDIETNGLDARKFVFGCVINIGTGERYHSSDLVSFREYIESCSPCIAYAHNGSKYDLYGLYSQDSLYQCKKVSTGTRVFEYEINGVKYRDSRHLFPMNLNSVAKSVGMSKGITPQEYIDGNVTEITQEAIDYCYLDCEIIVALINRLRTLYADLLGLPVSSVALPLTTASMSYRIWCHNYWPDQWKWTDAKKRIRRMVSNRKVFNENFRKCEHGGRVQVYRGENFIPSKNLEPVTVRNMVSYDANALYPSVMCSELFPDPKRMNRYGANLETLIHLINHETLICAAEVVIIKPKGVMGMLPNVDELGRKDWTTSEYDGWLCEPELRLALEIGYEIKEVKEVMAGVGINPFKEFVENMYNLRLKMREEGDPAHAMVKLLMNSLFGRFGIKERPRRIEGSQAILEAQESDEWPDRYEVRFYDGHQKYPYLLDYESMTRAPSSQFFGFSSFILSYGRERLMRAILASGQGFAYCDTDSVHMSAEYAKEFESKISIGDDLGQWKPEQDEPVHKAVYWEAKCYTHYDKDDNKIVVKHKGVRVYDEDGNFMPNAGDLTKEQTNTTIVSLYEALRRGLTAGEPITTIKKSTRYFKET